MYDAFDLLFVGFGSPADVSVLKVLSDLYYAWHTSVYISILDIFLYPYLCRFWLKDKIRQKTSRTGYLKRRCVLVYKEIPYICVYTSNEVQSD